MILKKHDVAIIGGGLAGIVSAIELAENNIDVAIIYDQSVNFSASSYAQGGIAAIISEDDSVDLHVKDTIVASSNTSTYESVNQVVENSTLAIKWLEKHGVEFDKKADGSYSLHLEGGHSLARILHIKDYTGRAVIASLYKDLDKYKNISIYAEHEAFRLLSNNDKCVGLLAENKNNEVVKFLTKDVILASGGASGIYKYVTNATAGTGSTMIMAADIGCQLKNLEFTQFHPTCFFDNEDTPVLMSEALRGNGAILETKSGRRIMKSVHEKQDLAPRDIVARQIYINMQAGREVFLNVTHLNGSQWQEKFPYIYEKLLENDIDPTMQRIPISPAAHYSCGGVVVDSKSKTSIDGLYAVGEVSYTGLHGANRLASNSLLECIVYGLEASKDILCNFDNKQYIPCDLDLEISKNNNSYIESIAHIKQLMWDKVGLVRRPEELSQVLEELKNLENHAQNQSSPDVYDINLESYKKIIKLAKLTIQSAIHRKESVGSHFLRKS